VTPNLFIARNVFLTGSTEIFLQNFMRNNLEKQKKGQLKIIVSAVLVLCVFVGVVIAVSNDGYEKSQVFYDDEQVDVYHKIVQEQGDTVFYEILVNDEIIHTTAKKGETLDLMNILDDLFADEIIPEEPVPETQSEEIVLEDLEEQDTITVAGHEFTIGEIVFDENGVNYRRITIDGKGATVAVREGEEIDFEKVIAGMNRVVVEEAQNETEQPAIKELKLAEVVGGKNRLTDDYARKFVELRGNYSYLDFKEIKHDEKIVAKMKIGNVKNVPNGLLKNDKKYAVELVGCDVNKKKCSFRVNGVHVGVLSVDEVVGLTDELDLKVKSIDFNTCGNVRFCDHVYEAYDEVEVEIG